MIGLEIDGVAHLLHVSRRTAYRWLQRGSESRLDARERTLELVAVLELLIATLRPRDAREWLQAPNRSLGGHKPIDLLAAGHYDRVRGAVESIAEGTFV